MVTSKQIAVVDAPSPLGLRPPKPHRIPGVRKLAESMRARGLRERLNAEEGGWVEPPAYSLDPEPTTGFRNGKALPAYTEALAAHTRALVQAGRFPVVLGGDCSILLGNMLALKPLGRYGLVFLDGHDDFSRPRDRSKAQGLLTAAGLDVALATGHGPDALTNLQNARPYVAEEDVILFGLSRDPTDELDYATEALEATRIHQFRIERVRELGARAAAEQALRLLEEKPLDGFWIHVDADVLDEVVMPAVDSPNPRGLHFDELAEALRVFLSSPRATGFELTIYDPELDPHGTYGDQLADAVVRAFGGRDAVVDVRGTARRA